MKKALNFIIKVSAVFVFAGSITLPLSVNAAPVSVSLSSSAGSVQQGSSFEVTVVVNTSGQVSDAQVKVTWNPSQLSYLSANYSGTPLTEDLGSGSGSGYYTADRYKLGGPYPSGSFNLVRLTLAAVGSSGNATIGISSSESSVGDAVTAGSHSPLSTSGVSVTLTAPPASSQTPASPGTVVPPSSTTGAGRSTPAAKPGNNATPIQQASIEQTAAPAVPEPGQEQQVQEDIAAPVIASTPEVTKKLSPLTKAMIGLSLLVVAAASFLTLKAYQRKRSFAEHHGLDNLRSNPDTSKSDLPREGSSHSPPEPAKPSTVIEPTSSPETEGSNDEKA